MINSISTDDIINFAQHVQQTSEEVSENELAELSHVLLSLSDEIERTTGRYISPLEMLTTINARPKRITKFIMPIWMHGSKNRPLRAKDIIRPRKRR